MQFIPNYLPYPSVRYPIYARNDHAIAGIDGIAYRGLGQVVGNELHSGLLS